MLKDSRGCRVLVVDDNVDLAITTALILRLYGHTSATAFTCREAIDRARAMKPDVVLLDMNLPDGDGSRIARTLRDEPALEGLRIIAVSACESGASHESLRDHLFDDYLIKPVSMDEILRNLSPGAYTVPVRGT